jgi:hypothetical protein
LYYPVDDVNGKVAAGTLKLGKKEICRRISHLRKHHTVTEGIAAQINTLNCFY